MFHHECADYEAKNSALYVETPELCSGGAASCMIMPWQQWQPAAQLLGAPQEPQRSKQSNAAAPESLT